MDCWLRAVEILLLAAGVLRNQLGATSAGRGWQFAPVSLLLLFGGIAVVRWMPTDVPGQIAHTAFAAFILGYLFAAQPEPFSCPAGTKSAESHS